jgi:branched-subunit amino acid transport protein
VRPGAAPPAPRRRRSLGPTPRYAVIPRWGLADRVEQAPATTQAPAIKGPSAATVRTTLFVTVLVLAGAALVYVVRYLLLVINRNMLLNSVVAGAADFLGVAASVAAIIALIACAVVLIQWLIARRAAAFSHYALPEHRSVPALWAGCLVPFANLLWAPVYVIELATIENHYTRLQRPIVLWWIAWVFSYVVSIFAIATSFATDSQGIANNTVVMVFAYLFAAAAVAAVARVFEGFERKPVQRPAHRWVVVSPDQPAAPGSAAPVELDGQEPAA